MTRRRSTTRRSPQLRCALAALAITAAALAAPSVAQDLFAVETKVNDAAITGYDIEQRARMAALESNEQRSREQLRRRALNSLIDDELKLQEAARRNVEVSDEQLSEAITQVAQRNGKTAEALLRDLASAGVERATFEKQLRAELAWNRLLRSRYGQRANPTEAEIEAALEDAATSNAETRYDVRQVVVELRPGAPRATVEKAVARATEARKRMTSCDAIPELKNEYSRLSGPVGVMPAAQMPGPVRAAVTKLNVGGVTEPLRSQDGLHLIMLCGKTTEGASAARRSEVFERLQAEKIRGYSENYLDDLRRDAIIESRS